MRLNISAWAIRKPIPSIVLFAVLTIVGIVSFQGLPVTKFPNIDVPLVSITVTQAGAAPAELETQVTKKVEDAIAGIAGVKHVSSNVSDGASSTTIEFRLETRVDRAVNDVKDAIARIRADLPRAVDEPIIRRIDIAGLPILEYAAYSPAMTPEELSWFVDDVAARAIQGVKGVGGVNRVGGVEREVRVALDPSRLLALGITAADVNRQLRATNVDLAGGRGELGGEEQSIRTLAGARSIPELAATRIAIPGGRNARLDELGTVSDGAAEVRSFARLDGRPVVAFAVSRAAGASDVVVAADVQRAVDKLNDAHPEVRITVVDSSVSSTLGSYRSAMHTLMEGAALAVLVVFVFLKDLRATIISAVALPLSVIPTFFLMDALGFSLNMVSLLAITLVTGILVDDAIVEVENIVRHMGMGKSPYRAAMEAADEIGLAVIAITFTIVAIFVPVSFMGGIAGQYFKQFGITVALAVLVSLLVARLITPMMAAFFLRPHAAKPERHGWIMRGYLALVRWSVRWRWVTLVVGLGLFAGSIASTKLLPTGFIPREDNGRALLSLELPPGSKVADTIAASDAITGILKRHPEVRSVLVDGGRALGAAGSAQDDVRRATFIVNFSHKSERAKSVKDLQDEMLREIAELPDLRAWFLQENGQRALSISVQGPAGEAVARGAMDLAAAMRRLPMLSTVVTTAALNRPEIIVRPRPGLAADLGVTTDVLSETIRVATIGDVGPLLPKFDAGDRLIPIRVQVEDRTRADLGSLRALKVPTARGGAVPLSTVAEVSFGEGPASISRYDRQRRVAVEADLYGTDALGIAVAAVRALPEAKQLPPGVEIREAGDAEVMGEVFSGFLTAIGAGLMMVYGVMVLLFASFLQPITILFSLPLSIGGAILGLLITGKAISMPVVIGILMLMGVVTKNAIMLVDFAVERIAEGMPRDEAIIDAGAKRARPIVMTTIAMAAGMLPSALAYGDGGEFRAPMAIAVIGGLIVSTGLSLVFVPAVFTLMDDLGRAFAWAFGRFLGPVEEDEALPAPVPMGPRAVPREPMPIAAE